MSKVRHHATGQLLEIVNVVLTDNNGTRSEPVALAKGSQVLFLKAPKFDISGIIGYTASYTDEPQFNEPFSMTLTPLTGYQALPWNTKVIMNSVDITSTAYNSSTGAISIANVTGDVSIEAEAVEMSSDYEPIEYIRNIVSNQAAQVFDMGFKATEKTHIMLDAYYVGGANLIYRMGGTSSNPAPRFNMRYVSSGFYFGYASENTRTTGNYVSNRGVYDLNRNVFKFNGVVKATETETTFTVSSNLSIMGANQTSLNPVARVYRCKTWEDDVAKGDYVPCRRKSDDLVGLYNCVSNTATIKSSSIYIAPFVTTTRAYTNCSATRLSADTTGTATQAVIGSTWSIKITPSSGYTFTGGTTPQVEIDGVDVTSTTVTDNGDGTYTVTIVDVPDKPISISAAAIEIPYDAEVEYLQGDGSAYIDTGIETTYNIRTKADITIMSTASSDIGVFGARTSVTINENCMLWYTDRGWIFRYAGGAEFIANTNVKGDYTIDNTLEARTMIVSGAASGRVRRGSSSFTTTLHYLIFAVKDGDGLMTQTGHDLQVKTWRILSGTTVVRDYVPVRKDGVGYLYDKVSGQLFGNANSSGAFTYGNDVSAVQSNSLLSGSLVSPSDTPDEPNDLDPIDMEDM